MTIIDNSCTIPMALMRRFGMKMESDVNIATRKHESDVEINRESEN